MKKIFFTFILLFSLTLGSQTLYAEESSSSSFFLAGMLPNEWEGDHFDNEKSIDLPKSKKSGGLEQFQDLVINNLGQIVRYLLISISILYIFINILMIILGSSDENRADESKKNAAHIMLGLMVIGLSSDIAKIFDPIYAGGEIGNEEQARRVGQIIVNYISLIAGSVAIFFMLIHAARMITAQGDESMIDEEKKNFQFGFIGLIFITLADVMINKVFYPEDIQAPAQTESLTFAQEIFRLLAYLLEFMAIVAILSIIVAGGYYIFSAFGDDSGTQESAKKIITNLLIGFILIIFAYVFVSAISPNLGGQVIAQ